MGMRHGNGKQTWKDGSVYVGDWQYDVANGFGKVTTASGSKYIGNWVDGEAYGKGAFIKNGSRFEGIWEKDILINVLKVSF
jgi:hypothetical protein